MNFSSSVPNFPLPAAYSSCDGRAHTHFYAYTAMSTDSWDLIGIVVLKSSALQHFSWASFNPVTHTRGILNIMSLSLQLAKDFFLISLLHYFNLITKLTEKKKCSEGNFSLLIWSLRTQQQFLHESGRAGPMMVLCTTEMCRRIQCLIPVHKSICCQ